MERLINSNLLKIMVSELDTDRDFEGYYKCQSDVLDLIDRIPTDITNNYAMGYHDALEGLHREEPPAEWVLVDGVFTCSSCGEGFRRQPTYKGKPKFLFCPMCGIKMMRGDGDD